ncbi:MAG: tetratricopeptide repeat protein [Gammaproteobacteria bacterium]
MSEQKLKRKEPEYPSSSGKTSQGSPKKNKSDTTLLTQVLDSQSLEEKGKALIQSIERANIELLELANTALRDTNVSLAKSWYHYLAENFQITEAQLQLGILSLNEGAFKQAEKWLTKAVAKGHLVANYYLAKTYEKGDSKGLHAAPKKIAALYQTAATGKAGKISELAYLELGKIYEFGWEAENDNEDEDEDGIGPDLKQAMSFYEKAIEIDHPEPEAQTRLAVLYEEAKQKDVLLKAFQLYQQAADQNYGPGLYHLGRLYENGIHVPKDLAEAKKYYTSVKKLEYRKSSDFEKEAQENAVYCLNAILLKEDDPDAQCYFGKIYFGRIWRPTIDTNVQEAFQLFHKAAEKGHAEAQYWLGVCYFQGRGTVEDKEESIRQFRLSAEQNFAPALMAMSKVFLFNAGSIERNWKESYAHYRFLQHASGSVPKKDIEAFELSEETLDFYNSL